MKSIFELGNFSNSTVQTGPFGAQLHAEDYVDDGVPFILIKNIKDYGLDASDIPHITYEDANRLQRYALQSGDVVFSRVGRVGSCFLVEEEQDGWLISGQLLRIRVPESSIFHRYLIHALRSKPIQDQIIGDSVGTTRQSINTTILENLAVPVPPFDEQERIADILDTADAAIQQTEQLIAKLKQVKAGLLHDLLTRGLDEHGNLRDPEAHPEQFKVVDGYGRVPKEWEFVQIKDIARQVTDGDHHTPQRSESGILLLSARNVLNGVLDLTDVDYVPKSEYLRMIKRCHPEAGDILISCSGTVGRVCAVPEGLRFVLVRSVALIKFDDSRINSRYAEWMLRSNMVQSQIIASQRQAAQPNLFQGPIKDGSIWVSRSYQNLDKRRQKGFAPFANIMDKLEESQINW